MKKSSKHLLLLAAALLCTAACDDLSCPLESTVECHYGFYAEAVPNERGQMVAGDKVAIGDTLTITALRRPEAGGDTVLLNRATGQSAMALPVSYYAEEDIIELAFTDTLHRTARDTLWMQKENVRHWDDPGCPMHMWHNITGVRFSRHLIDTVFINHHQINYAGRENFQICFRTGEQ